MQTLKRFSLDGLTNGKKSSTIQDFIGIHNGVRVEVWRITPELASGLLEKNHNRPVRPKIVKRYARRMAEGRWLLNYEWIGLDEHGFVIEGQHRLMACAMAGVPFETLVLTGLPRDLFPFIGGASPRTGSDVVALDGHPQAKNLAAALSYVWRAEKGIGLWLSSQRPDNDEVLSVLHAHPTMHDSVKAAAVCSRVYPSIAMLAYLHYEFKRRDPEAADAFVSKLASGANLKESDPVFVLRERLLADKGAKAKLQRKHILALTIKAWNYVRAGRRAPKFLRWSDGAGEPFPSIQ